MAEQKKNLLNFILWGGFTFLAYRYFFGPKQVSSTEIVQLDSSGERFKVPASLMEREPLNKTVNLFEKDFSGFSAETDLCFYDISTKYAAIKSICYKNIKEKDGSLVCSLPSFHNEQKFTPTLLLLFGVVGGSQLCPEFILVERASTDDGKEVFKFKGDLPGWDIYKTISISKASYELDLKVELEPDVLVQKAGKKLYPRIMFMAPKVSDLDKAVALVSNKALSGLDRVSVGDELTYAWKMPFLFGADNRFFIHSFVGEKDSFTVKRGFYDKLDAGLGAFLELWPVSGSFSQEFKFYFGPKQLSSLEAVCPELKTVNSFSILSPVYKAIITFLEWLFKFLRNYGWALMILALVVRLFFLPATIFCKNIMQRFAIFERRYAAEISEINHRYAENFAVKNEQLAKFYGTHDLSFSLRAVATIIPLFIQIFVIFCLYRVLVDYIAFYNAPFILWIKDLSSKDPYYVLPVIFGLLGYLQQYLTIGYDKKSGWLPYISVLIIPIFFSRMPAGMILYLIFNSLFTVIEEWLLKMFLLRKD